jgi:ABC-type lipoprotein export system ATPase subunit
MTEQNHQDANIIEVKHVSHEYLLPSGETSPVLSDVDFTIKRGGFAIIHGPSGSGKSTLINIITGLIKPTKGAVIIDGHDISQLSDDQRAHFRSVRMGLVHQSNYWVKSLSVVENVALPLYMTGMDRATADQRAYKMIQSMQLEKYADYKPTVLSGGQQQRISMARALVGDPTLIVADEPTGNLDSKNGDMVMNMLDNIRRTRGKTVLLVTHDLRYLSLSNQQINILDGKVTNKNVTHHTNHKPVDTTQEVAQ